MRDMFPRVPAHVAAVETTKLGTRYHGFLFIAQRDKWVDEDPGHRAAIPFHREEVHAAWDSFTIVLHPAEKGKSTWNI